MGAEETRGGLALTQKVEHPQLKFLIAPLVVDYDSIIFDYSRPI